MVMVRILGTIDLISSMGFLIAIFGFNLFTPFLLFCAGLLFVKGLFVLTGEILSVIDMASSISFIILIFFPLPSIILWTLSFLLLAKGTISFL